ncbi:MAG TPA: helix-turn-helix domain-containing protein [Planctomycetota bacterium]|nr:helix-turn-helix domain-containing protein [Planctomycetota bacterium]
MASHARLAELYGALAEEHARLAREGQVQLAAGPERALMSLVPATATEPVPAAPFERPDPREFERLLSVRDLAQRLGVDPKTVRRWRRYRVLPEALVVGGVVRWRPAVIDAWLASRGGQQ